MERELMAGAINTPLRQLIMDWTSCQLLEKDPDNKILQKLRTWEHPETIELNKLLTQFEKDKKYPEHSNLDWGSINYNDFMKDGE